MTLRGVIQGLLRSSDDAEAMLADEGYGDLPPEIFGQALSSYADTAPMAEADALSPVLTTLDAGNASDVFAVLEEQPLTLDPSDGAEAVGLGASVLGAAALDDMVDGDTGEGTFDDGAFDEIDDFGASAPIDESEIVDEIDEVDETGDDAFGTDELDSVEVLSSATDDPFAEDEIFNADAIADTAADFEEQEDFFDTEPVVTGEDPSDLDF